MASQPPIVTQADLDAYIASYQKAQADKIAQLKAAEATGMSDQYTQLYGGADIIPGTTQGILSNLGIENPYLPVYSLIGSESVGNNLANERMQFAPIPGVSYRLVNKATGETTTATTPEEIRALIAQSNALSAAGGKKADLAIESNQTGAWTPVFTDAPNPLFNDITKLALAGMVVATGAGLLQPGGLGGVGAAGTTGATGAGATGAATAGSGLVPGALTGANALSFAPIATTAIPAGVGAASDLVITALMAKGLTLAEATALAATGGAAAALSTGTSAGTSAATNAATNAATSGAAATTGPELVLTAAAGGATVPTAAELAALAAIAGGAPAIMSSGTAAGSTGATGASSTTGASATGAAAAGGVLGTGLTISQLALLTGLSVSAIEALINGKGSGETGTGTGTPYVSPFGTGPAIGGADFRVNPNIQDYERYGFGGEATFFRPEYYKLVSSGASMGGATTGGTATTNTPTYNPLIDGTTTGGTTTTSGATTGATTGGTTGGTTTGGTTTGGTTAGATTTGGTTTGGTTAVTKQERPAGFTGVVSGQQAGDTQVVNGTTWAYGGDKAGWQMQYKDPTTGNLSLLPGNGATNVSSFKNNPTVAVNQPYFAQNTANIPGWAETYQGFQRGLMSQGVTGDRKAAAERELFSAIETQPFANPQSLVDYARTVYNKYTTPGLI